MTLQGQHSGNIEIGFEVSKKEKNVVSYLQNNVAKKYVFSKYTPKLNAQQLIDFEGTNKETIWFICGIGLGYIAEEILKVAGNHTKIIMLEPNETLYELQKPYLEVVSKDARVTIFTGDDEKKYQDFLEAQLSVTDFNNIKVIQTPVYIEMFNEYYMRMIVMLREYVEKKSIEYNTIATYAKTNLENLWKNKEAIKTGYDITSVHNRHKNVPAVIVSAGPSLNKNIAYLKDFKGIIFTGTRTLPAIRALGIKPDYLVCVDPTEKVYEVMQEHGHNDIDLIATEVTSPLVVAHNTGKKYMLRGTQNAMCEALFGVPLKVLPQGGSVATLCTSSAYYMGCNPIIFIGQDLAHTNQKAHADDFMSYDTSETKERLIEGFYGDQVATSTTLLYFLRWFEKFIADYKGERTFINCTEGGAKIKGAQNGIFAEIVKKYQVQSRTHGIDLPLCSEKAQSTLEQKAFDVINDLKQTVKIARLGSRLSQELLEEYTLYKGVRLGQIEGLVKKLNKQVDEQLKGINLVAAQMFESQYVLVQKKLEYKEPYEETELQRNSRITRRSLEVYSTLAEALEEVITLLETLMDRSEE